jgi:hypothetical protein
MDIRKQGVNVKTGWYWLRTWSSNGLLWKRQWNCKIHKSWYFLTSWLTISEETACNMKLVSTLCRYQCRLSYRTMPSPTICRTATTFLFARNVGVMVPPRSVKLWNCSENLGHMSPLCLLYEGVPKSFRTKSITKYTAHLRYHSLRSNAKGYGDKPNYSDSKNSDTTAPSGRELYHMQFSLRAASPETFGYTIVLSTTFKNWFFSSVLCDSHTTDECVIGQRWLTVFW